MKSSVLSVWLLLISTGFFQLYSAFQSHFSGIDELQLQVTQLSRQVSRARAQASLARFHAENLRQTYASLAGENDQLKKSFSGRNLASILTSEGDQALEIEPAASLFSRGKSEFLKGHYATANEIFTKVKDNYPYSSYLVETYFLLSEGLYQTGEKESCLQIVKAMVNHYPENDLTGFALLRVASVMRERERNEDALEIYRSILRSFTNPELKKQAKTLMSEVDQ